MDERILAIRYYDGQGYRPLIDFKSWRVAILRWLPEIQPEFTDRMERHTQSDEVFVLLSGLATLLLGGISNHVESVQPQVMEAGKLYNVRQNAWHAVLLSQDAMVLIVEESNTGAGNTEYFELGADLRAQIMNLG